MEAYLDNSATTRCCEEAAQLVVKLLTEDYGNPSSLHNKGVIAENYMNDARKKIAKTLKVQEKEICFTSGGTESNNLAIIGVAEANKRSGKHVITTSIEHPSVSATMAYLEEHGYEVTYLPVDAYGVISLDDLKAAIRPDTILVSLMQVNNEIGAVEPVAEAGALIKQCNPQTLFHVDAIQAYGKRKIVPAKLKIDLLSVSGHKIHGPKGTGFLYVADGVKMHTIIHGGSRTDGVPEPRMCRESPDWDWRQRRCTKIILRKYRRCMNAKRISSKNWKRLTKLPFTRLHRNCVSVRRMSSVQALKV